MLLREHRFKFFAGAEEYVFRIEELVAGVAGWPGRFRLQLPASFRSKAKTYYGASCEEVTEKAAEFITVSSRPADKHTTTHFSQGPPASPRQTHRSMQLQISEND
jgi:hypothetical protein